MPDFTKKVRKHAADTLEPGEQVLSAAVVAPRGSVTKQAIAGGVGGLVGAGIAAAVDKKRNAGAADAPQGSWAEQFPKKKVFMSVTDRRVVIHAFGEMSGRPKEILGWIPREAIAGLQIDKGRLAHPATLHFSDGSAYEMDVMRGTDPAELAGLLSPG